MSGKEAIIEKIIKKAEEKAKDILQEANAKADETRKSAQVEVDKSIEQLKQSNEEYLKETARHKNAVAELNVKRYDLQIKRNMLKEAYVEAHKRLSSLSDTEYVEVYKKLLKIYAEKGEKVIVGSKDKDKITQKVIDEACPSLNLKIVGYKEGNGLLLTTDTYDKTLNFGKLLELKRDDIEPKAAEILFAK
ncbi:MAG: V-type ATP synthase subunit E family protein [Clostridia bacterium]